MPRAPRPLVPGIPGDRHPRDLSEGQRLALALALVLAARPPVVLLDEPTRGLDYTAKRGLAGILRGLADDGPAVLVATHDVEFVALVADEVVVLAEGEVVSYGPVRRVRRRVAGVRAAGHQGARPAVAAGRRGRAPGGVVERRHEPVGRSGAVPLSRARRRSWASPRSAG